MKHEIIKIRFSLGGFMEELLRNKGFSLNTYPEGKFWELTVEEDEV